MKRVLYLVAVFFAFVAGAIAYTWPGPVAIWEQRTDVFLSDGTDPTTSPFHYDLLHRAYLKDPSLIFYGAFPNPRMNSPEGYVAWYSPLEKMAGLLFPFVVPVEQVSTLITLVLMVLNGLCFYGMARSLKWERLLSFVLAFAWAFSSYTRARAQVHPSLVGIYCVPLAIWAISILQKNRDRKAVLLSALCFLGCVTSPHYYIIFLLAFSPFLIAFYFTSPQVRASALKSFAALILTVLPAVFFLALSFLKPVPSEFQNHVASVLPMTGKAQTWPHPFLEVFSAQPRDFFAGDIAVGTFDWNPLRSEINHSIRQDPNTANFHEHAIGIRWVLWVALLACLVLILKNRKEFSAETKNFPSLLVFSSLGVFSFLCSLQPDWGWIWGPSAWIHFVIEQIRVPSRYAIFTHFSVLMILGLTLNSWMSQGKFSIRARRILYMSFGLLILMDFPPGMNSMPMASISPSLAPLISQKSGVCGLGMHFPHASGSSSTLVYYTLLQRLRGTDCSVLNPDAANTRNFEMTQQFGYENKDVVQRIMSNDLSLKAKLVQFAKCNKLDWMVFDPGVPMSFAGEVCRSIQGRWMGEGLCRSEAPANQVPYGMPDICLIQIR